MFPMGIFANRKNIVLNILYCVPHGLEEIISLVQDYSIPQVIITHINHDNLLHAELVKKTASHGITVAYDGLTLEV